MYSVLIFHSGSGGGKSNRQNTCSLHSCCPGTVLLVCLLLVGTMCCRLSLLLMEKQTDFCPTASPVQQQLCSKSYQSYSQKIGCPSSVTFKYLKEMWQETRNRPVLYSRSFKDILPSGTLSTSICLCRGTSEHRLWDFQTPQRTLEYMLGHTGNSLAALTAISQKWET